MEDVSMATMAQHLRAAVMALPTPIASAMREALASGAYTIEAGRYNGPTAICPLAAADAHSELEEKGRFWGWDAEQGYGGSLLRFALCFDLFSERHGIEIAVGFVQTVLGDRLRDQIAA
jgi:hypothetical protein